MGRCSQGGDDGVDSLRGPMHDDKVIQEWRKLSCEADILLRSSNFRSLEGVGKRFCDLQAGRARGWMLRYLSLQHLQAPQSELVSNLREGIQACNCSVDAERLADALRKEEHSTRPARPQHDTEVAIGDVQVYTGEWDAEGVFLYQAFSDEIADWAIAHQRLGGPF